MSRRDLPVEVQIPPPGADQAPWTKVGIVAAIGFVVGVVWPRLVGLQIGPAPPNEGRTATHSSSAGSGRAAPPGSAIPLAAVASAGIPTLNETSVTISTAEVSKCKDAKGKAVDKCDELALDPLFTPRLKELSKCPSAIGLAGKVTVSFDLDFKHKSIRVQRAKGIKLPRTTIDGITKCAEKGLSGVSLDDLTHEQTRYSVAYVLSFTPPGKAPEPEPLTPKQDEAPKAGVDEPGKRAEVVWRTAQVRDAPKTGNVISKLTKGTKVSVLEQKDGWCRVDLGDKKQGWLFHEALGLLPKLAVPSRFASGEPDGWVEPITALACEPRRTRC